MKNFFKENFVLIAGLCLPVILTLIFLAASFKPALKNPPTTPVMYTNNYYAGYYNFNITNDGQLEFTFTPPAKDDYCCDGAPLLYVYDPITKIETQIKIPDFERDKKFKQIIPYANKLSASTESPDGWIFQNDYNYGDANLMTALFGGFSHNENRNILIKDGHRIPVGNQRYANFKFVAWTLPEKK